MKNTLRTFNSLRLDDRFDESSNAQKADLLEALITRTAEEFLKCMHDIGNDNEQANKQQLAKLIDKVTLDN